MMKRRRSDRDIDTKGSKGVDFWREIRSNRVTHFHLSKHPPPKILPITLNLPSLLPLFQVVTLPCRQPRKFSSLASCLILLISWLLLLGSWLLAPVSWLSHLISRFSLRNLQNIKDKSIFSCQFFQAFKPTTCTAMPGIHIGIKEKPVFVSF